MSRDLWLKLKEILQQQKWEEVSSSKPRSCVWYFYNFLRHMHTIKNNLIVSSNYL